MGTLWKRFYLGLREPNRREYIMTEDNKTTEEVADDLIPKPPSKLAPRGITSFTVFRQHDETGVSGDGVVIEGVVMATGPVSYTHLTLPTILRV